ncbi:MAG TPA: YciI family protein [Chitinophagaceae bacterium]|nr:YciI family protein [Chitinophagaceae bacterium]
MTKKLLLLQLLCVLTVQFVAGQDTKKKEPNIKQYWLVILKTGLQDKVITDSTERSTIFKGHFANMERLYYDGVLKAAGPFGKNDLTWRGLFILDCASKEEAEKQVKTDPSVLAGVFIYDIVPWYSEPTGSFKPGKPEKKDQ